MKKALTWLVLVGVYCMASMAHAEEGKDIFGGEKIVTLHAGVMEVSDDCSWLIVGERMILMGDYLVNGIKTFTRINGVSTRKSPRDKCAIQLGDDVVIRGVIIEGEGILAYTIKKE